MTTTSLSPPPWRLARLDVLVATSADDADLVDSIESGEVIISDSVIALSCLSGAPTHYDMQVFSAVDVALVGRLANHTVPNFADLLQFAMQSVPESALPIPALTTATRGRYAVTALAEIYLGVPNPYPTLAGPEYDAVVLALHRRRSGVGGS